MCVLGMIYIITESLHQSFHSCIIFQSVDVCYLVYSGLFVSSSEMDERRHILLVVAKTLTSSFYYVLPRGKIQQVTWEISITKHNKD